MPPKIDEAEIELNPSEAAFFQFFQKFEDRFKKVETKLDSAMSLFEARSFSDLESLKSPAPGQDASHDRRSSFARQSLGSYHSSATASSQAQELTIRKSSFRLEKPKNRNLKLQRIQKLMAHSTKQPLNFLMNVIGILKCGKRCLKMLKKLSKDLKILR